MKAPSDGWDADEREVLALGGLSRELEGVRARHELAPGDEARLLARIQDQARQSKAGAGPSWGWGFVLAAASVLLVVGAIWMFHRGDSAIEGVTAPASTVAVATPSPAFYLPLDPPAVKVSPSALAWRGPTRENPLLADLKPAFDAFRAADYQRADREFSALSGKYPASIEVAFYQGVARLFVGNAADAIASLTAAERLADSAFAWDVSWYRAVAEERAGNLTAARTRLTGLCAQPDARAKAACDALTRLPGGRAPAP
jgi:hypothetical protein